jgi:hypothetical protein
MSDGEKQVYVAKNISKQFVTNMFNVGFIFQSIWVRCRSVFSNIMDRKFMESELRFVLYCGIISWVLFLFSKIVE